MRGNQVTAERVFAVLGVTLLGIGLYSVSDLPSVFGFLSTGESSIPAFVVSTFTPLIGFIFTMGAIAVSMYADSEAAGERPTALRVHLGSLSVGVLELSFVGLIRLVPAILAAAGAYVVATVVIPDSR